MASGHSSPESVASGPREFRTTHWSIVLAAGDAASPQSAEALEKLCRAYWFPLYAYVRRSGHGPEDAQDLTQAFLARFLENNAVSRADRQRGRFRAYLLASLQNFINNEWRRACAEKRGGGRPLLAWDELSPETHYQPEAGFELTPDKVFDQRWALTLFEQALTRLRQEFAAAGKREHFERLKDYLSVDVAEGAYAEIAAHLGISRGAVTVAVHRLRQRYGQLVRDEVAHTVASPAEVEEELRYLIKLISG
jgi:RNA polymerase sigma-70 factor (ECF subfamily)